MFWAGKGADGLAVPEVLGVVEELLAGFGAEFIVGLKEFPAIGVPLLLLDEEEVLGDAEDFCDLIQIVQISWLAVAGLPALIHFKIQC